MEQVIQVLQAKAAQCDLLYKNEMQNGSAEWAMKYEHMGYGLLGAIDAGKELRDKAKKVPV